MPTSDPLFGVNWTMNKGASKFSSNWTPDFENRLYEETPSGYKLTVAGAHQGKNYSWGYDAKYDGQDHPPTGHGLDPLLQRLCDQRLRTDACGRRP